MGYGLPRRLRLLAMTEMCYLIRTMTKLSRLPVMTEVTVHGLLRCVRNDGVVTPFVPVNQFFEKDMEELLPLPAKRFEAKRILNKKTDNYSNVTLENIHKYTLPPEYRNSEVIVETWAWKVAIYDLSGKLIEEYDREYGETRTESISAVTSINALVRKPGSWNNSIFRSNLADGNPFKDYIDGLHDEELKHRIFYKFRKAMNTFEYHVVMQSFTEMASRDIDMTKECNVAACCSRIESCPLDFSYNPTEVSLDKYGCFMKFTEEDYAEVLET